MDWRQWHAEYNDSDSRLSRRLAVVQTRLAEVLTSHHAAEVRLLSLCGGEARDVIPVLAAHPKGRRAQGYVVELDEVLAQRASDAARSAGLARLQVRCADAGDVRSFRDVLPVEVLLLCGIFGNVDRHAVRTVVRRVPSMVTAGGFVIWTRAGHDGPDDPRAEVRRWFGEAGMPEMSFDGSPESHGVGVNRVEHPQSLAPDDIRLFEFTRSRRHEHDGEPMAGSSAQRREPGPAGDGYLSPPAVST